MEKEVQALKEKLEQVEGWRKRKEEIEKELGRVWVAGEAEELPPPMYLEEERREVVDNGTA